MIIFLYGADTYRSSQKLQLIKDKFLKEVDASNLNLSVLEGAGLKFQEFNQQVKAAPFLARKRMIIIKNLISDNRSKEIQKEIVDLLDKDNKQPDQQNIIVFWEGTENSKSLTKHALWQRLIKEKLAEEFKPLNTGQLTAWVTKEFSKRQVVIDNNALDLLTANVGNDLWQMSNEIEKLVNYKKGQSIILADIESSVKAKYDDDIFKLVDALGQRNKKLALKLMSDQLSLGTDKLYLLSMLIRQFRILLLIKDLQQTNSTLNKAQISQQLQLHPFVAQKALYQVQNFTLEQLKQIYQQLLDMDQQLKSSTNKAKLVFDLFIAQI